MMPTCAICKVCSSWPRAAQCASPCAMRYVLAEAVMPTLLAGGGGGMPQPLDGGHSMPQPLDGGHSPGLLQRISIEQCHRCNSGVQPLL